MGTNIIRFASLFILVGLVAVGIGAWSQSSAKYIKAPLLAATPLPDPIALPSFTLKSTRGGTIDNKSLLGHWSFIYFGFTSCPDICPATLSKLKAVAMGLDNKNKTDFIFISADPRRDNLENLEAYVSAFSDRIQGGLGSHEQVAALAKSMFVYLSNADDPNQTRIDHSDTLLLINPKGKLAAVFQSPQSPEAILSDLLRFTRQG